MPVVQQAVVKKEEETVVRRFQVLYGRISTKTTQKTYEKDGILEFSGNQLILRDEDGYKECSTLYYKSMRLKEDSEIIIEPKEVKIIRELGTRSGEPEPNRSWNSSEPIFREFQPPRMVAVPVPSTSKVIIKEEKIDVTRVKIEPGMDGHPSSDRHDHQPLQFQATEEDKAVTTQEVPLDLEEMVIYCRAAQRQRMLFDEIYEQIEQLPAGADANELLEELQDCCNGPITTSCDVSGKLTVLHGIVQGALALKECVLIIGVTEPIIDDLLNFCADKFNGLYRWLATDEDAAELTKSRGSMVVITTVDLLDSIVKHRVLINRTIVYEAFLPDVQVSKSLAEITRGPIYHLLICGSIEERLFQMTFKIVPDNEEGLARLRSPGDYDHAETHKLLDCDCQDEDDEEEDLSITQRWEQNTRRLEGNELRDSWEHIRGKDQRDHFQVSRFYFVTFPKNTH